MAARQEVTHGHNTVQSHRSGNGSLTRLRNSRRSGDIKLRLYYRHQYMVHEDIADRCGVARTLASARCRCFRTACIRGPCRRSLGPNSSPPNAVSRRAVTVWSGSRNLRFRSSIIASAVSTSTTSLSRACLSLATLSSYGKVGTGSMVRCSHCRVVVRMAWSASARVQSGCGVRITSASWLTRSSNASCAGWDGQRNAVLASAPARATRSSRAASWSPLTASSSSRRTTASLVGVSQEMMSALNWSSGWSSAG